jgi:hypothetical protein
MERAHHRAEGRIIDAVEGRDLSRLATLGRGEALAIEAEALFVRGIAVVYEITGATATAVLLQDATGRWFDLYGRQVTVTPQQPQQTQLIDTAPLAL